MEDEVKGRVFVSLVKFVLALGLVAGISYYLYHAFSAPPKPSRKEVIELIRSEEIAFLTTDRIVTKVVAESKENSLLLGKREGFLIATVRIYYGVDLQRLPDDAIRMDGDTLYVAVPTPKELDFSVDMDSVRFLSKKSGLMTLRDFLQDLNFQQELQQQLHHAAQEMLRDERLVPRREDVLRRLNVWASALSAKSGLKVIFR